MLGIARLGSWLHHPFLNSDTLSMLLRGNTADPQPLAQITGIQPKSLEHVLAEIPVTAAEHWYSKLYFLKPLLRISIAFIWLFTGIVSAFIYPVEHSYQLLAALGISGWLAPLALFGAAGLDFSLGLATLLNYPPPDLKKNEIKPWRKKDWVIPPQENAEFVASMEKILDV